MRKGRLSAASFIALTAAALLFFLAIFVIGALAW